MKIISDVFKREQFGPLVQSSGLGPVFWTSDHLLSLDYFFYLNLKPFHETENEFLLEQNLSH